MRAFPLSPELLTEKLAPPNGGARPGTGSWRVDTPKLISTEIAMPIRKNPKQTGRKAASAASKVLSNPKSSKLDKRAAASALSQTPYHKKP
jgi:hypothetical protein